MLLLREHSVQFLLGINLSAIQGHQNLVSNISLAVLVEIKLAIYLIYK